MPRVTSYRPADGQVNGHVEESTGAEVDAVVASAVAAAPAMERVPPWVRRAWLEAIADRLESDRTRLARIADAETGLGLARLDGEIGRAASQLRFYGAVAQEGSYLGLRLDSATATSPRLVRLHHPRGPVVVFGASNFPFGFGALGNDTASALAAGCPVVVKGHPAHPLLNAALVELAQQAVAAAGGPVGAIATVQGLEAGQQLVVHDDITAVGFTGSQAGGLALWRLAQQRPVVIPVYAEMSTVNPVAMTPTAVERLDQIAAGFVGSFTLGSGQFCTKPGLLLAPAGHGVAEAVGRALSAAAPSPLMLTRSIAEAYGFGLDSLVAAGATEVARVPRAESGWSADAVVLAAPAIALSRGSRLLEECFGPVAVVVEYADTAELRHLIGLLQGSLAGTVVTDGSSADPDAPALVSALSRQVGRVTVDDWPTGVAWTWAQHHGGPWPATTAPETTSVGASALERWVRPVTYQSMPELCLPEAARSGNLWRLPRRIDGRIEVP
ncbi:aldehyde dehydrogenase family protein [Nocardioides sp.]|uniref:aldehyde dehydrogenase family protein n=1 Tax=Nocardioides sp. TaxID=35761 RepID=UPI0026339A57|nr:aldehyde dehydrogenase family protein [Nocardioides sp.]